MEPLRTNLARQLRQYVAVADRHLAGQWDQEALPLDEVRRFLRQALVITGSVLALRRWHAPAADHSAPALAFAGRQHHDADSAEYGFAYGRWASAVVRQRELAFLTAYGHPPSQECLLVNAGVSAINLACTIVLRQYARATVPLYVVGQPYSEGRDQVRALAAVGVVELRPVADTGALLRVLAAQHACRTRTVVYADAIENGPTMRLFDLETFLRAAPRPEAAPGYLILDRTLVGHQWRPLRLDQPPAHGWQIIEVESLTKYHQLGCDLGTAGAVYLPRQLVASFVDPVVAAVGRPAVGRLRATNGWMPAEAALLAWPPPSAAPLAARLRRHQANAVLLAATAAASGRGLWRVVHPSLPSHPDAALAQRLGTTGGLVFLEALHPAASATRLCQAVLAACRRHQLLASRRASFGFNETTFDPWGEAILRVSAGTEPVDVARRIAGLLAAVLRDEHARFHATSSGSQGRQVRDSIIAASAAGPASTARTASGLLQPE